MTPIYVIAIQESGGGLITSGHDAYVSRADAQAELERLHTKGMRYMKIFTLYPNDSSTAA